MNQHWWKEGVVYQLYPRSFFDSNGDGIGDLKGVIAKLDYLTELGVDIIWLNPVYQSPNRDNGYDISDYRDIMKDFGDLSDMDELLKEAHGRGLKIVMDLVVNHTSIDHPWFIESRSSRDNEKRDYYIWRDGKNGKEPNNWEAYFSQPAWTFDATTGQFYLNTFLSTIPDLNWENPKVREEIYDMMKWWLDRGIDGFRMDVINHLKKPEGLPDSPRPPTSKQGHVWDPKLYANNPGIHEILQEMNQRVLSRYDVMTVGETPQVTPEEGALYVDERRKELNMVFHFEIMDMPKWDLRKFKDIQKKWYTALKAGGWNCQFMTNHDFPRQVSRFGDDGAYRRESAKMLATVIHTLPGTPFVYQGEEIGMTNMYFPAITDYRDPLCINKYRKLVGEGVSPSEAFKELQISSRDNSRTPMQWDSAENAGFTKGRPWIGINPNHEYINVENERQDPGSVLNYYKQLIRLRKENRVMVYGDYTPFLEENEEIIAYLRADAGQKWLVVANFTGRISSFEVPRNIAWERRQLVIANIEEDRREMTTGQAVLLKPYEARIYRV